MKKYNLILLIIIQLFWYGCAARQNKPIAHYTLKTEEALPLSKVRKFEHKTLQIQLPRSTKEIKKNKILYTKNPLQRDTYLYSRWSDTPNRLIAYYFRTYLAGSNLFKTVIDERSIAKPDYILESNLEEFYQLFETDQSAYGVLKIHFFLIDAKKKKVIASYFTNFKIPASSPDAKGGVEALQKATKKSAEALLGWLQNACK